MSYAPILTETQIERIRRVASPRRVVAGEVLYEPNDETPPAFVVISGAIRIVAVGEGSIVVHMVHQALAES
jgi:thioredoxin reductase (NADPH)